MGATNPESVNSTIQRYQKLKLNESLSISYRFSLACCELGFILKSSYSKFPKNLQALIFQDTLFAFTLLPDLQTQSAISAAHSLLQSAEFVLPKQKRALAVKEYKRAVVASKRKSKANQEEEGSTLVPQDVLVHIFSFLDLQSLVTASAVCRTWSAAAGDNHLWKFLYNAYFCASDNVSTPSEIECCGVTKNEDATHLTKDIGPGFSTDWRSIFRTAFKERCSMKFKSNRGYCSSCCSIVWLNNNQCSNNPCVKDGSSHLVMPIALHQIVTYILDGSFASESSSDSDSDPEDTILNMWAYPRFISAFGSPKKMRREQMELPSGLPADVVEVIPSCHSIILVFLTLLYSSLVMFIFTKSRPR